LSWHQGIVTESLSDLDGSIRAFTFGEWKMRKLFTLCSAGLIVLALGFSANALNGNAPDEGCDLELVVTPDVPCKPGDVIDLTLSGAHEDNHGMIIMGEDLGSYTFYKWELDLIPTFWLYLGLFSVTEEINLQIHLPNNLPPGVSGMIFNLQGVSAGMGCCGMKYLKSDLDTIEIE